MGFLPYSAETADAAANELAQQISDAFNPESDPILRRISAILDQRHPHVVALEHYASDGM